MATIIGDFDGSGCVDGADYQIFHEAFGSQEGDPNWNPACDLNGDGVVNIQDFAIFHRHYNEGCTPSTGGPTRADK